MENRLQKESIHEQDSRVIRTMVFWVFNETQLSPINPKLNLNTESINYEAVLMVHKLDAKLLTDRINNPQNYEPVPDVMARLRPNKHWVEIVHSASHVCDQMMTIASEYEDEIEDFEMTYNINKEWALLFRDCYVILEQYVITEPDCDSKDFIQQDLTSEWMEHGDIMKSLGKYLIEEKPFMGDDGKEKYYG